MNSVITANRGRRPQPSILRLGFLFCWFIFPKANKLGKQKRIEVGGIVALKAPLSWPWVVDVCILVRFLKHSFDQERQQVTFLGVSFFQCKTIISPWGFAISGLENQNCFHSWQLLSMETKSIYAKLADNCFIIFRFYFYQPKVYRILAFYSGYNVRKYHRRVIWSYPT